MSTDAHHRFLTDTPWSLPTTTPPAPAKGTVHLWRTRLEATSRQLEAFRQVLTVEETARAKRFNFARDRDRYVIARATLKILLGNYLGLPAPRIDLTYGAFGKPALHPGHTAALTFNLSHAGGYALYGFAGGAEVGVDLELEDLGIEVDSLVHRYFSPTEAQRVLALPGRDRRAAFFRTWTRKEAFIKAHGHGLSLPLERFRVSVDLASPVRLEAVGWAPEEVARWAMVSFEVAKGLPGALVVERSSIDLPGIKFFDTPAV